MAFEISTRELELAWGMHSTFVFIGMRRFIYNMPLPEDLAAVIRDQVRGVYGIDEGVAI